MLQTVTGEELEQILLENLTGTILVTFSSSYLGDCRILHDIIGELTEEFDSNMGFYSIDADEDENYVIAKGVYHVPATFIYNNSELVFFGQGLISKSNLRKKLRQFSGEVQTNEH